MQKGKLSPEDRAEIVRRVEAGEKQKDLAAEYNVSEGYISHVKDPENTYTTASPSLENLSVDELRQRQDELKDVIRHTDRDKYSRLTKCRDLNEQIQSETAQLEIITDPRLREASETRLQGMRDQVAALDDHTRLDRDLIEANDARTHLAKEYVRRGLQIPGDLFF